MEHDKKALHFFVDFKTHFDIKMASAKRNITMNKWIERALQKALVEEKREEPAK